MKNHLVLMVTFIVCSFSSMGQNQFSSNTQLLSFMGVTLGEKGEAYRKALENHGFSCNSKGKGWTTWGNGDYWKVKKCGVDIHYEYDEYKYYHDRMDVNSIFLRIPYPKNWNDYVNLANDYITSLTEKYGDPTIDTVKTDGDISRFSLIFSFTNGDGLKDIFVIYLWKLSNGYLQVAINTETPWAIQARFTTIEFEQRKAERLRFKGEEKNDL